MLAERPPRQPGALLQPLQVWPPLRLMQPKKPPLPMPLHLPSCLVPLLAVNTWVAMAASVAMTMAEGLAMVVMQPPSSYLSCPSLLKKVLGCLCPRQHRAVLQVHIFLYLLAKAFSAYHTFACPGVLLSARNTMVKT